MSVDTSKIAIVGLGYVGLPLALLAAKKGYEVAGIDLDEHKIERLAATHAAVTHPQNTEGRGFITFGTDFQAIESAHTIVICVPTPVDDKLLPDLTPVQSACLSVAQYLSPGQLVVLESTVNPGVSETVVLPSLELASGLKSGQDFYLAHCPERINPGDEKWNVQNIPRVVGSTDKVGLERAVSFYESIIDAEITPMQSIKEAEAVKVVENTFRDVNIAFVNELAMSFDKLGINVLNVINGAATKPFAFMQHLPGCGVGGHCIPVDPYYLIEYAKGNGFNHEFLSLARRINRQMPRYTAGLTAELLAKAGVNITGAKVVVLGLAYKPDVSDTRESPSHVLVEELENLGAQVTSYDPFVPSTYPVPIRREAVATASRRGRGDDSYFESLPPRHQPVAQKLDGADAVVIATAHGLFKAMSPSIFARAGVKAVVDGRNCLDRKIVEEYGILYKGIGS